MRTKLFLFVVALAIIFPLQSLSAHSNPGGPAPISAQAAGCADKDFLTTVAKDFTDLGSDLGSVKGDKVSDLVKASLSITKLRQKYEDMDKVPDGCFGTQLSLIVLSANIGDMITLSIAKVSDAANAADYDTALKAQQDRTQKLLELFKSTLVGAATPAAN